LNELGLNLTKQGCIESVKKCLDGFDRFMKPSDASRSAAFFPGFKPARTGRSGSADGFVRIWEMTHEAVRLTFAGTPDVLPHPKRLKQVLARGSNEFSQGRDRSVLVSAVDGARV
jgi:hypothetical protein